MSTKLIFGYCLLCGVCCFTGVAENRFNPYRDRGSQADVSQMREIPSSSRSGDQSSSLSSEEIYSGTESDDAKTYIYLCGKGVREEKKEDKYCGVSTAGLRVAAIRVASEGEFDTFSKKTNRNIIWSASVSFGLKGKTICTGDSTFHYYIKGPDLPDNEDFFHDKNGNSVLKGNAYTDGELGIERILRAALFRWETDSVRTLTDFFRSISNVGKEKRVKAKINGEQEYRNVKVLPEYDKCGEHGYNCARFAEEALFRLLGQDTRKSKWKWVGNVVGTAAGSVLEYAAVTGVSYFFPPLGVYMATHMAAKCVANVGGSVGGLLLGGRIGDGLDNAPEFVANRILSAMKKRYESAKEEEEKRELEKSFKIIIHTKKEVDTSINKKRAKVESSMYSQHSRTLADVGENTKFQARCHEPKGTRGTNTITEKFAVNVFLDTDFDPSKDATDLMSAACRGRLTDVFNLLDKGTSPNIRGNSGMTALILAAQEGYTDIVNVLMERGADPNARDDSGKTALICAAQKGYAGIVDVLMRRGADLNIRDDSGKTALIYAMEGKCVPVASILMKNMDVQVNIAYILQNPGIFVWAVLKGSVNIMNNLLVNPCVHSSREIAFLMHAITAFLWIIIS